MNSPEGPATIVDWVGAPITRNLPSAGGLSESITSFKTDFAKSASPTEQIPETKLDDDTKPLTVSSSAPISNSMQLSSPPTSLDDELFANRAALKVLTSRVAMHLRQEERRLLFSEVDRLLDIEHWEDTSSKINEGAFQSFLRFMIFARPHRLPNLGVGYDGALLASWRTDQKSVQAEFLSRDNSVVLIKTLSLRGGAQTIAWRGEVADVRDAIERNRAIECLDG